MHKDFISIADYSRNWIEEIFDLTAELKTKHKNGEVHHPLKNKTLAMIYQKTYVRTRVSVETGMW